MSTVTPTAIERFTALKQKREALSRALSQSQGRLEASRDRYKTIMRELQAYGIGSLDELNRDIQKLDAEIAFGLDEAEQLIVNMEAELRAIDSQEAGAPAAS